MHSFTGTISNRKWIWAAGTASTVLCLLLLSRVIGHSRMEGASPDRLDFGTVDLGSTLEASAKLLISPQPTIDRLYSWCIGYAPGGWRSTLYHYAPKTWRRKHPVPPLDLSALKPKVQAPPYVHVDQVTPTQISAWYDGRPFIVLSFKLDCSQPGQSVPDQAPCPCAGG